MITANQIIAHFVGDFVLQSDWMANEKSTRITGDAGARQLLFAPVSVDHDQPGNAGCNRRYAFHYRPVSACPLCDMGAQPSVAGKQAMG